MRDVAAPLVPPLTDPLDTGLPRENSDALVRPFVQRRDEIRTHLSATSFAVR